MDVRITSKKSKRLNDYERTLQCLLEQAGRWLGDAALPVQISWQLLSQVHRRARRIGRQGLAATPAVVALTGGRRGHELALGLELREITTAAGPLHVVWVSVPFRWDLQDFYCVATRDMPRFYRWLRRLEREALRTDPPLMMLDERERLWQNTLAFLLRDPASLLRLDAPQKRGVLLRGEPGNGKSTACRWLRYECLRRGLAWKQVDHAAFETARGEGETHLLFELGRPGIIVFDDFDQGLRDRQQFGDTIQTFFLGELDGLHPRQGLVYLFTSNLSLDQLDPAALRPGRIDTVLVFPHPNRELRRRLFVERWQKELCTGLELERLVDDTDGWSFADLEEARKQLALSVIDGGGNDWELARRRVLERRGEIRTRCMGFAPPTSGASA